MESFMKTYPGSQTWWRSKQSRGLTRLLLLLLLQDCRCVLAEFGSTSSLGTAQDIGVEFANKIPSNSGVSDETKSQFSGDFDGFSQEDLDLRQICVYCAIPVMCLCVPSRRAPSGWPISESSIAPPLQA